MPRKSTRTASTTYRCRQLTWDDTESCNLNLHNEKYPKSSKLISIAKTVTPSPSVFPVSNTDEKDESLRERSSRRKQLFTEKKASRIKPAATPRQVSSRTKTSPTSAPKRLFSPLQTDDCGASSAGHSITNATHRKGYKGRVPKRRSLGATAKVVALKRKSGRYHKRKFTSGDSLATLVSLPSAGGTSVVATKTTDRRKGLRRHSIRSTTKGKLVDGKRKVFSNPQTISRAIKSTDRQDDFESTEKRCTRSVEGYKKTTVGKKKKPISSELISLLVATAPANRRVKRTRSRSTKEILDEFNKNKKELKSKQGTRTSLPRACKSSKQKRFVDEDTDEGSENTSGNDDDDWTLNNAMLQLKNPPRAAVAKNETTVPFRSSTSEAGAGTNLSLPSTTLKPRPRGRLPSSASDRIQKSFRPASPTVNDDCEYDTVGGASRKRKISKSQSPNTSQYREPEILSPKIHQSKNNFAVSTDSTLGRKVHSSPRTRVDTSENLDWHEQASMHSKRKRRRLLMHATNDSDEAKSAASRSSTIGNGKASLAKGRQQHHRRTQLFKEHYSGVSNCSSRVIADNHAEAIASSSKNSNNSNLLRMGSQQRKQQSNSLLDLVSLPNGESRSRSSPTRRKQYLGASPRRKKEQQHQLTQRNSDKEVASSKKRVRFDSSTTTFSVKIKIKTNLDARSQNKNGGKSVQFPPSLDESAVQAIANQVTQACLTQARTSARTANGDIIHNCGDPGVKVNVDVNGECAVSSHQSESSSNSSQNSEVQEESGYENHQKNIVDDTFGEREVPINEVRTENWHLSQKNLDDGRSITSELTSDWNRPRPSRYNDHDQRPEKEGKERVHIVGKGHSVRSDFSWKDRNDNNQGSKNAAGFQKTHFLESHSHRKERSVSNTMRPPPPIMNTHRYGEARSHSSLSRRQRMRGWGCSDSLAGSGYGSIASMAEGDASVTIPREVSLRKRSNGSTGWNSSRNEFHKTKYASAGHCAGDDGNQERRPIRSKERDVENTLAVRVVPSPSRKSRIVPFSPSYRCGKCKGCRRTFDCQTCDTCLEKINFYGSPRSPSIKEGPSLCLSRRCQRACRIGSVDSLLGTTKSSSNPLKKSNSPLEQINATSTEKSPFHRNSTKNPIVAKKKAVQDSRDSASVTMKAPWEEGDDWTVDYSYLSEPEYRRHWGKIAKASSKNKTSLSTRSLSTPSWWLPGKEKQTSSSVGGGGRTSLSSVSESVVPRKQSKWMSTPGSILDNKQARGKRRGGKQKKGPLHGLALPKTTTDDCSVTSWRANRKCLRALMEYDEADQDWM